MAFVPGADRVLETTTTTGTGSLTLAGAKTGFRAVGDVLANGDTCYFGLEAVDSSGVPTGVWEAFYGTYTASGELLSRDRVYSSSNSGSLVDLQAGTTNVFIQRPAIVGAKAIISDEKSAGTDAGTATLGSWETRTLNTVNSDLFSLVALSSNQFTLQPGIYQIVWSAPAYSVTTHKSKLYNITGAADAYIGSTERAVTTTQSRSVGATIVAITAASAFEIQHQVASTISTTGYGIAAGFSVVERYTIVEIECLG